MDRGLVLDRSRHITYCPRAVTRGLVLDEAGRRKTKLDKVRRWMKGQEKGYEALP